MYLLTLAGVSRSLQTLLEVLSIFRSDPLAREVDANDVSLSLAGHPIEVTRFNGRLTVRRAGSASRLFLSLIDEIDGAYFRPDTSSAVWRARCEVAQVAMLSDAERSIFIHHISERRGSATARDMQSQAETLRANAIFFLARKPS